MKKDVPLCINFLTKKTPYKGLGADSEEKHEPVSDIDTAVVDSLKALDPNGRLEKQTSARHSSFAGMPINSAGAASTIAVANVVSFEGTTDRNARHGEHCKI